MREYFPETLLWAPLLETDSDGQTRVKFRLADNITTWKLQAVASTETGELGAATADIRAFQPFFIDHAPPRILTQGDELQLPATIHNYLERAQDVSVSLRPEQWFQITGQNERPLRIAAGASLNTVFPIRATAPVIDG